MPADQARALELALNPETALQGSLVMPDAWSVNCRQFALLLRARAQQEGCRFEFGNPVVAMQPGQGMRLACEKETAGTDHFDSVVLCAGAASDTLLAPLGVRIPLETWQGHSLSAAVREPLDAPVAVVHDLRHGVSIARMGQRVRVSGPLSQAERSDRPEQAYKHLYKVLDDWFPGSIRHGQAGGVQEWSTRVSATPDGLPAIGRTSVPGLWVNTGHGMHGWVMACGSARLLADQMAGGTPTLGGAPYDPGRWVA
jgi:D-amino-acid dehydrogenase